MKIIGVIGRKRSGKDTFFNSYNTTGKKVVRGSFADQIKEDLSKMLDIPLHYFHDDKLKEEKLEMKWGTENLFLSPRECCIRYGRFMADNFGALYWVFKLFNKLKNMKDCDEFIITDVRFLVEVEYCLKTFDNVQMYYIDADQRLGPMPDGEDRSETESYLIKEKFKDILHVLDNNGPKNIFAENVHKLN